MSNNCMKCENQGKVVLRKKDFYCEDCFITNVNHKFRATIGKNRILFSKKSVLISLSGGLGSTVLLDLISDGISLDNHKKLLLGPIFFHVVGLLDDDDNYATAKSIIKQCNNYSYDIYVAHIADYNKPSKMNLSLNDIPELNNNKKNQLVKLLNSMKLTSQSDHLTKIKRDIFISYARELNCNYIFSAETTSRLAINLLSNLTLGRGSQVQHDIGFCDNRNDIKIIRPMKDISHEELYNYIKIKQLTPVETELVQENSLQHVIQTFVNNLQENFPSTISTVCKTAEKIGIQNNNDKNIKCLFCESDIGERKNKLSALEATNFSRTMSVDQKTNSVASLDKQSLLMFPHVDKYFCYSCSKNYQEMDQTTIPDHIKNIIQN